MGLDDPGTALQRQGAMRLDRTADMNWFPTAVAEIGGRRDRVPDSFDENNK